MAVGRVRVASSCQLTPVCVTEAGLQFPACRGESRGHGGCHHEVQLVGQAQVANGDGNFGLHSCAQAGGTLAQGHRRTHALVGTASGGCSHAKVG